MLFKVFKKIVEMYKILPTTPGTSKLILRAIKKIIPKNKYQIALSRQETQFHFIQTYQPSIPHPVQGQTHCSLGKYLRNDNAATEDFLLLLKYAKLKYVVYFQEKFSNRHNKNIFWSSDKMCDSIIAFLIA